ncbi:hypothetical protein N5079_06155 [Planotetraspora sp. A-T 1434]|uniref:hypothetical protein n=1 Tax=Planotetraspora sp. A-T 1434 TaxID=2979219 RepID=UPI0021BF394A|nr:hypothetical protein [Planotetraspora sp. A-T 1434]MCT9929801.1 hypothetical protein [Planotetraspora sp. A-T 1434]
MREIRKIRERTKRSHQARAQRGKFTGGPRRFGWLGADQRTGRPCNMHRHPDEWPYFYRCVADGKGSCGRVARNGELVDLYLTELVLQKLEKQFQHVTAVDEPWPDSDRLAQVEQKATNLRKRWRDNIVSDDFFYTEFPQLEAEIKRLRADQQRHTLSQQRRFHWPARCGSSGKRWTSPNDAPRSVTSCTLSSSTR